MRRFNFTKALIAISAFAVGMAGVMGIAAVVFAGGVSDNKQLVGTADREEAQQAAGYDIVAPRNFPDGMVLQFYLVDSTKRNDKADFVDQYWYLPEDNSQQWISVSQGPIPAGLVNGRPTTISGVAGERVLYESDPDRPYQVLSLYWPHEGGFLGVTGSLVGDQTEDTLRAIADSLISP